MTPSPVTPERKYIQLLTPSHPTDGLLNGLHLGVRGLIGKRMETNVEKYELCILFLVSMVLPLPELSLGKHIQAHMSFSSVSLFSLLPYTGVSVAALSPIQPLHRGYGIPSTKLSLEP